MLWFIIAKRYLASSSAKGKDAWNEAQRKLVTSFQESSPSGVTENMLIPRPPETNYDNTCEMLSITGDSVPRVFIGGWLYRHSLPGIHQNFRLPDAEQMFNTNHTVHTNSLSTVSPSHQSGNSGNPLKIQILKSQPRVNLISRSFKG